LLLLLLLSQAEGSPIATSVPSQLTLLPPTTEELINFEEEESIALLTVGLKDTEKGITRIPPPYTIRTNYNNNNNYYYYNYYDYYFCIQTLIQDGVHQTRRRETKVGRN
jgi:hypothetical protein